MVHNLVLLCKNLFYFLLLNFVLSPFFKLKQVIFVIYILLRLERYKTYTPADDMKKNKQTLSSPLFTLNSSGAPLLQLSKSPLVGESGKRRGYLLWFMKVVITYYPNFRSNFLVIFIG